MLHLIFVIVVLLSLTDGGLGKSIHTLPEGITLHNVLATYKEAQAHCESEGGIIASPFNETLFNAMKSFMDVKNTTFYIGAQATDSPGQYAAAGVSLENMTEAMINMSPQLDPLAGDCVSMNSDTMRVVPCWSRLPYMCLQYPKMDQTSEHTTEGSINKTETTRTNCGTETGYNYDASTGNCYKLHTESKTWDKAQSTCLDESGYLAVIANVNEAQIIKNLYNYDTNWRVFIGIKKEDEFNEWKSVNGQPLKELYSTWNLNSTPRGSQYLCGTILESGELDDGSCEWSNPFVCQKEPVA